jgi:heterodisulfide reductase subunit A
MCVLRTGWEVAAVTDRDPRTRALIVGAGIAGMQAALDIADAGYEVVMVDRLPSVGGRMAQLSETFPTLDCAQCILTPRTVEVGHHEHIQLLTYSEVEGLKVLDPATGKPVDAGGRVTREFVSQEAGSQEAGANGPVYRARIRRHAAYVDWDVCTGCGVCQEKCPARTPSDFESQMGDRKAIYTLSPQAVPNKPVIDREHCIYFQRGKCRACEKLCPVGAIAFEQEDAAVEEEVGAIILAPGYDLYGLENMPEYGGGHVPDVIDALSFERLLSSSGPTVGQVRRPSDGREPREIVFIQCAGSRDPEKHLPYCSKICCMYTAKQATLYGHRVHGGQAYIFYIDIRAAGKGYDEFTQRAMEDENVVYLRGKVSRVFRQGDKVMVWGADTLSDRQVQIKADMVVVAPAMRPRPETARLATMLGLPTDEHGWLLPLDSNTHPVETHRPGVFLAGAGTGPMDIPETVAHASGAAAQVLKLFSRRAGED